MNHSIGKRPIYWQCFVGLFLMIFLNHSWANLLINPTRIKFDPNDRHTEVTLINTGKLITTYRLALEDKKATAGGGYIPLSAEEAKEFPSATDMLRISPRQVTLKPGERQTIKLLVRRPRDLADGEYRSHLLFKALPRNIDSSKENQQTMTMSLNINLSFSVPVIVQQGELNYDIDMQKATISYDPTTKTGSVKMTISRSGAYSIFGNVQAFWKPKGGNEKMIAALGDYNCWPELKENTLPLIWTGEPFSPSDGELRIEFKGKKEFKDKIFFNKTVPFSANMIEIIQNDQQLTAH